MDPIICWSDGDLGVSSVVGETVVVVVVVDVVFNGVVAAGSGNRNCTGYA